MFSTTISTTLPSSSSLLPLLRGNDITSISKPFHLKTKIFIFLIIFLNLTNFIINAKEEMTSEMLNKLENSNSTNNNSIFSSIPFISSVISISIIFIFFIIFLMSCLFYFKKKKLNHSDNLQTSIVIKSKVNNSILINSPLQKKSHLISEEEEDLNSPLMEKDEKKISFLGSFNKNGYQSLQNEETLQKSQPTIFNELHKDSFFVNIYHLQFPNWIFDNNLNFESSNATSINQMSQENHFNLQNEILFFKEEKNRKFRKY
ncbi:hypothetical protein ABK040_008195 [Willaertia magna]